MDTMFTMWIPSSPSFGFSFFYFLPSFSFLVQLQESERLLQETQVSVARGGSATDSDEGAFTAQNSLTSPSAALKAGVHASDNDRLQQSLRQEASKAYALGQQVQQLRASLAQQEDSGRRALRDRLEARRLARRNAALEAVLATCTVPVAAAASDDGELAAEAQVAVLRRQLAAAERDEKRSAEAVQQVEAAAEEQRQRAAQRVATLEAELAQAVGRVEELQQAASRRQSSSGQTASAAALAAQLQAIQHENAQLKEAVAEAGRFAPAQLVATLEAANSQLADLVARTARQAEKLDGLSVTDSRAEPEQSNTNGTAKQDDDSTLKPQQAASAIAGDTDRARETILHALDLARGIVGKVYAENVLDKQRQELDMVREQHRQFSEETNDASRRAAERLQQAEEELAEVRQRNQALQAEAAAMNEKNQQLAEEAATSSLHGQDRIRELEEEIAALRQELADKKRAMDQLEDDLIEAHDRAANVPALLAGTVPSHEHVSKPRFKMMKN